MSVFNLDDLVFDTATGFELYSVREEDKPDNLHAQMEYREEVARVIDEAFGDFPHVSFLMDFEGAGGRDRLEFFRQICAMNRARIAVDEMETFYCINRVVEVGKTGGERKVAESDGSGNLPAATCRRCQKTLSPGTLYLDYACCHGVVCLDCFEPQGAITIAAGPTLTCLGGCGKVLNLTELLRQ
jgi:hypothetical protein